MSKTLLRGGVALGLMGLLGLAGCTEPTPGPSVTPAPTRLADVVVTDPHFDFATSETVRVELRAAEGAAPRAIEVRDADGRRLMDGAFKAGATVDLKVPVGRSNKVTLRVGSGDGAVERELTVDAQGHAVTEI